MADDAKTVWVLSDGRPGHFNQSKGVIKALSLTQAMQVEWVDMRLRVGVFRILQREWLKRTQSSLSPAVLNIFYSFTQPEDLPDLIVSAGGRTSFASAWLARFYNIPNIFIGSLRSLPAELFSAVLTLEPIAGASNNIVLQFPVSEIDPDYLNNIEVPERLVSQPCWALLVGGNGSGYEYQTNDWNRLGSLLDELAEHYGIHWLISTTPRTGKNVQQIIEQQIDNRHIADAGWFSLSPENKIPVYLAAAEKIFVTEDSMTMIGEALGTGKPVFSLQPETANPNERYRNALERYIDRGLLSQQRINDLQNNPGQVQIAEFKLAAESPLKTLSRQLLDINLGWR